MARVWGLGEKKALFDNGWSYQKLFEYMFKDRHPPVLFFGYKDELSRTGWTIKSVSSEEGINLDTKR